MMLTPPSKRRSFLRFALLTLGTCALLAASALLTQRASAQPFPQTAGTPTPLPSPTPTFDVRRLDKPAVSESPSQVERGRLIYWGICLACHGDVGQGLTDEWRFGAFGQDNNCWESECHGKNHPPHGFEIPKKLTIPPLALPGSLARFQNAQQLYDYVSAMMPWWKPGSLSREEAWQVTARLLEMNGSLPAGLTLSEFNASAVPVHRLIQKPKEDAAAVLPFAGALFLAMLALFARDVLPRLSPEVQPRAPRPNFIAHLHPPSVPALQARWRHTLGAGGIAVLLCLILFITGLLETVYYVPTPEKAAVSVETITTFAPFGFLVRNLHYWAAQLLVVVAFVHLARVVFTGAYGGRRRFNFLLGTALLALALLLDFTGYALRWDEGIRWALTAGTNLLKAVPFVGEALYTFAVGGGKIGPAALIRFYSWHIFGLTAAFAFVVVWHLFRVRRDGGIAAPPPSERAGERRISRFELLRREVFAALVVGLALLLWSAFMPAPLAVPLREATVSSADANAPWFFLWVQQLLKFGDPFLLGVLLPFVALLFIGFMPYLFRGVESAEQGSWFPRSGRIVQLSFAILTALLLALTLFGVFEVL